MNVLCADKTGTLTCNALTVTTVHPMPGFAAAHVLALATLASSDGGQDPLDGAIRSAALGEPISDAPKIITFVPFDPATKMSEATVQDPRGSTQRLVKSSSATVVGFAQPAPTATAKCGSVSEEIMGWRAETDQAQLQEYTQLTIFEDGRATDYQSQVYQLECGLPCDSKWRCREL